MEEQDDGVGLKGNRTDTYRPLFRMELNDAGLWLKGLKRKERKSKEENCKAKMVEVRWIENQRPIHVSVANAKPFGATSKAKTR
jgi:hypothetical protein